MIASGIYHIVIYTAEKEKATILDLFTGVIVMVLGIFLFFTPQIVIKILPYLLGALVLVDSIWKIKGSYRLKKAQRGRWKIILIGCLVFIALGVSMLLYSFLSVTRMILFSGIILTADGVADIVFLIMIRLGMKKSEKLCAEKEQEENGKEKPWDDPADAGLDEKVQDKSLNEDETEWKQDTDSQVQEAEMEIETGKTADAADADAILDAEINKKTENLTTAGIHFIDSGNYHYMTRLWLTRMDQPFCLLVYDNHTDMQPPAFGGILSCGGWIAAALEELENLKYVILVGPDEAAYEQVDENLKDRVIFLSREKLQVMNDEERNWFLRETVSEVCNWRKSEGLQEDAEKFLPLYISVDKDVLCTEDAQTTWSQGDMRLTTLVSGVQTVLECAKESSGKIAGVDICGEADAEAVHENEANDYANEKLLEVFEGLFEKSDCE